jgi:eukaryotic-like serine/threonine-protein kinase
MRMDSAGRWRQIESLYHAARQRTPEARAAFLAGACDNDEELRREVESLLAQPVSAEGVLDGPALAVAAQTRSDPVGSSLVGRRLGVYEVVAPLAAGGMGVVYRAHDTRLRRDVALKVLPREFTADPERLARFEREARVLAALNHPNIAAIFGVEEIEPASDPEQQATALVLELVEGDTLAERIQRSAGRRSVGLPFDDTLTIALQIADALDAAHDKGIVHRDLKPANVKITPAGVVKVLDFGLAKLVPAVEADHVRATDTPTMTVDGTRQGLIVGTAAYMSPEQARGHAVDKRTDIWAFGCVLYEMLTGRAAFARETITDTLAAVLEREPDWSALPSSTSALVRRLLEHCLNKDPKRRLRDIGDVRLQLDDPLTTDGGATSRPNTARQWPSRARWMLASAALVILGIGATVLWMRVRSVGGDALPSLTRTTVMLSPNEQLDTLNSAQPLALSPDGRRLVYVARREGIARLYLRDLAAFEAKPIAGTEGAQYPFFSPDGEWVAFFAGKKLKRVSISGGSPVPICDVAVVGRGGTWGLDGTIVFDRGGEPGLMRVSANGGTPERVTSRDHSMDARNLMWPQFLPDGRALVATVGQGDIAQLAVLSFDTGTWHPLGRGLQAHYLPSGHFVFHAPGVREGELRAVDVEQFLAPRGEPVSVLDGVFRSENGGGAYFAIAQSGTLVYAPGSHARTLVRVDRNGRRTPLLDEHRGFRHPRISPDGRSVAVAIDPRPSQVWVYDIARRTRVQLATTGHSVGPLWTPDGRRVTYSTNVGRDPRGFMDLYWRMADGSTVAERLLARDDSQYAQSWSRDGQLLVFTDDTPANGSDILVLPLNGDPRPLIATPANEYEPRLSPDGRWIAYHSDESGSPEVYVRPFPNVNDRKWTVSTSGGGWPVWSPTGRELFYMNGTTMMAVPIESSTAAFAAGAPVPLFNGPFETGSPQFDVSPDGTSFVMVEADPNARPTQVHVVLNWAEEVKRLASARQ